MKIFIILGAINAFIAVALGAFGAHGLKDILGDRLPTWETAVNYQMFHALGLITVGILTGNVPATALLSWSGWLMFSGIVIFSGSLYVLSITKIGILGAITPIGGVAFLVAWVLIIIAAGKYM